MFSLQIMQISTSSSSSLEVDFARLLFLASFDGALVLRFGDGGFFVVDFRCCCFSIFSRLVSAFWRKLATISDDVKMEAVIGFRPRFDFSTGLPRFNGPTAFNALARDSAEMTEAERML